MIDHEAVAKRYRDQAEEFRVKSEMMRDESARRQYLKIADAFDGLADNEDMLALKNKYPSIGSQIHSGECGAPSSRPTNPSPPASSG
ncbi:hypothetical protein ACFQZO_23915 [Bradyrhizobium sp. GCM10027634]|uniref:hypothetical protein n=1 Tax=unclassified Bradyrhizobium TaxID=2631580 RepID=UPI00263A5A63|nr:hypothetical protein [Bradyrhizobium sp. WYCCWR 12677]MDN5003887.1 hypothetical protein [Bradyrhizobium sp. WYCCWR 12677]